MLSNRFGLQANSTVNPQVIIDTEKGVVVDSRALSQQQYNKYYRTQQYRTRPDLNPRQSSQFFKYYRLGQNLLSAKKAQLNANILRFSNIASRSYVINHLDDIFGKSLSVALLAQRQTTGYLRTDEQRQKIAAYAKNRIDNMMKLGLGYEQSMTNQQKAKRVESIAEELRRRYVPNHKGKTSQNYQRAEAGAQQ